MTMRRTADDLATKCIPSMNVAINNSQLSCTMRASMRARMRRGVTVIEVSIACVLLSAAIMTTTAFQTRVTTAAQNVTVSALAREAVINAREQIGSWQPADVSEERIVNMPIRDELQRMLPEAAWNVRVDAIEEPINGHRIFLDLTWSDGGQTRSTSGITFWIMDQEPEDENVQ